MNDEIDIMIFLPLIIEKSMKNINDFFFQSILSYNDFVKWVVLKNGVIYNSKIQHSRTKGKHKNQKRFLRF